MAKRIFYRNCKGKTVFEGTDAQEFQRKVDNAEICATCRFSTLDNLSWTIRDDSNGEIRFECGECRLNPPGDEGFPAVLGGQWCGRYERGCPWRKHGI
jgi:hypothetical protein